MCISVIAGIPAMINKSFCPPRSSFCAVRKKRGNPRVIPHEQENCSAPSSSYQQQRIYPFPFLLSLSFCACLSVYPSISPSARRCAQSGMESSQPSGVARLESLYASLSTSSLHGFQRLSLSYTPPHLELKNPIKQAKAHIFPVKWNDRLHSAVDKETATLHS